MINDRCTDRYAQTARRSFKVGHFKRVNFFPVWNDLWITSNPKMENHFKMRSYDFSCEIYSVTLGRAPPLQMRGDKEEREGRGEWRKEKSFEWSRGVLPPPPLRQAVTVAVVVIFSADPFMALWPGRIFNLTHLK